MSLRFAGAIIMMLTLSACVSIKPLDRDLSARIGQPAETLFDAWGYPNGETDVVGRHAYVWGQSGTMVVPTYRTATTTGTLGSLPFSATTGSTQFVPAAYDCTIRVFVDGARIITGWDLNGNYLGCEAYQRALHRQGAASSRKKH